MITIEIHETTYSAEDMATLLERIANMLKQGYTSGIKPTWSLIGEEEEDPDMEPEVEDEAEPETARPMGATTRKQC